MHSPYLRTISSIISRAGNPYCRRALRAMSIEFGMAVVLPYPLAVRAPEFYHIVKHLQTMIFIR